MKYTIGFSPCPNDTFIFDALVNNKIATEGIEFQPVLEDIQTLNEWAAMGKLDITKISFPAFFQNENIYSMLDSGSALGKGVGPLLIAKKMVNVPDVAHSRIAIPGENTTANFLLRFVFPAAKNKIPMLFSEIEDAVLQGVADLGVIIHENRFTYQNKGLIKICDLGEIWEERQKAPIPLACIAAKKEIPETQQKKISLLIRKSLEHSFIHYPEISSYTRQHAQAMEEDVMRRHIDLYVNDYSLDLGIDGKRAIEELHKVYESLTIAKV
ncbi:MAG TPA: 1,4-dihydroxy-6-naphthoate synthase [Flavisolibacter sp.]|jgi:1,4-dihydroxy-6-naphthoate synthase|nr:1,4-dihydroxy-6-naphthoate synthase [Flavisolibacter sp.]